MNGANHFICSEMALLTFSWQGDVHLGYAVVYAAVLATAG